jgi:hypothetical protein
MIVQRFKLGRLAQSGLTQQNHGTRPEHVAKWQEPTSGITIGGSGRTDRYQVKETVRVQRKRKFVAHRAGPDTAQPINGDTEDRQSLAPNPK